MSLSLARVDAPSEMSVSIAYFCRQCRIHQFSRIVLDDTRTSYICTRIRSAVLRLLSKAYDLLVLLQAMDAGLRKQWTPKGGRVMSSSLQREATTPGLSVRVGDVQRPTLSTLVPITTPLPRFLRRLRASALPPPASAGTVTISALRSTFVSDRPR